MFRKTSISVVAFVLMTAACGSDEGSSPFDEASTGQGSTARAPSGMDQATTRMPSGTNTAQETQNNQPAPYERAFEGLVIQAAPWGDLEVRVTGARVFLGERPEDFSGSLFFENVEYAVLDVNVTALGNDETDYRQRNTWDLILADGTRDRSINPLGLLIAGGDSPTAHLYYSSADFTGAALELNGAERGVLEPLRIPLDVPQTFESDAAVESLAGQVVAPTGEGDLQFEVLEARYGVNLPELGRRARIDTRMFSLNTRVGYSGSFSKSFSSTSDGPKIVVDGNTIEAVEGDIDTIPSGDTIDFLTIFEFDEEVTEFELTFDTGDGVLTRVPVVLPALL
jgi:hypothetical protein